jgi:hypothetical protein
MCLGGCSCEPASCDRQLRNLPATPERSEALVRILGLDNPSVDRLPRIGGQERSLVVILPEDLDAQVGKVEVDDVDTTLVPVEQTDPTIWGDPQVRRARITVHNRHGTAPKELEDLKNLRGDAVWQRADVGVQAPRESTQLVRSTAPWSLHATREQRMKASELCRDEFPVRPRLRLASFYPALHDNTVRRSLTVVRWHDRRDEEVSSFQIDQQIELPRKRLGRSPAVPHRDRTNR